MEGSGQPPGVVSSGNPVAEGVTGLLTYLADGGKPVTEHFFITQGKKNIGQKISVKLSF